MKFVKNESFNIGWDGVRINMCDVWKLDGNDVSLFISVMFISYWFSFCAIIIIISNKN